MITVALFGAAGKMGTRISERLKDEPDYKMLYVEGNEAGKNRLLQRGLKPTETEEAINKADIIILAIPDALISRVSGQIVPMLKSGDMVICLDPAAPYAGLLPDRKDISYFVVHPCHPPVISDDVDPDIRMDFFGGSNRAKQNIVCALMQGKESDYAKGEKIARKMFAPVMKAHRIAVEQMAILEPAMAETVVLTCMTVVREAMDEAVRRGVPAETAKDFLMGHLNVNIGILFNYIDAQVSDGAKMAVERARDRIFQPDWKKVFEIESILDEVKAITKA